VVEGEEEEEVKEEPEPKPPKKNKGKGRRKEPVVLSSVEASSSNDEIQATPSYRGGRVAVLTRGRGGSAGPSGT
jgi:hypothetical protein